LPAVASAKAGAARRFPAFVRKSEPRADSRHRVALKKKCPAAVGSNVEELKHPTRRRHAAKADERRAGRRGQHMEPMRRIVMFNRVTADGYFAGPDGNLEWVVPDEEVDKAGAEAMPGFDTILFGRRTYELFEGFWPRAVDDSPAAPDPHGAGRRSPTIRAMAIWINEATKLVFSRTRKDVTWRNSRLFHEFDPREIETMKRQTGKNMIVFGSGSLVSQLTQHGLIDEYHFVVSPIFLGSGRPLLSGVSKSSRLDLLEAKGYPSGNVMLRYARSIS
jgi:dihydrofolate reductase